ncbi:MAG TPA: hypothetical protein VES69_05350 [Pyrinomonadaceae bacterium]|nr:hypothetical protein [Pyrinomonadaceae bacterium]
MVDEEVESTLREIRERVRKTADLEGESLRAVASSAANVSITSRGESAARTPETMARIDAYLATTARAWDRLPPLVSNRSGGLARLELWVKRRFKQATRWYSWEQINFNAAVHHALRDTLDSLLHLEQQLGRLRADMSAQMEAQTQQLEQNQIEMMRQGAEIESQRAALESQTAALESQRAALESQKAALESQRAEIETDRAQTEAEQRARSLEVKAHLADLTRELRERDQQRLEEQRVCFKQLSLEMSEAEVLLDRARRDIDSRLDKLESSNVNRES